MRDQLATRLDTLRKEFQAGQVKLQEMEIQAASLRETLLRISGAVQVLEETLNSDEKTA